MFSDSRAYPRLSIPKYYTGGAFHLVEGTREYHYIRANDVCVTGIGLDVPSPIEPGSQVKVRYTSQDWRTDLEGIVMWCSRADRVGVNKNVYPNYRIGVRLNADNSQANALLFLTVKDDMDGSHPHARA